MPVAATPSTWGPHTAPLAPNACLKAPARRAAPQSARARLGERSSLRAFASLGQASIDALTAWRILWGLCIAPVSSQVGHCCTYDSRATNHKPRRGPRSLPRRPGRARTLRRGAKASASRSRLAALRAGSRLGARLDEPERAPSPGCAARGPQPLLLRLLRLLPRLLRLLLLVLLLLLLLLALIAAAPARLGHGGGPRQRPCLTPGATPARPLAAGRGSALQPRSGAQIDWSALMQRSFIIIRWAPRRAHSAPRPPP